MIEVKNNKGYKMLNYFEQNGVDVHGKDFAAGITYASEISKMSIRERALQMFKNFRVSEFKRGIDTGLFIAGISLQHTKN